MSRALTPELVHQIRATGLTDTEWARRLNVAVRTVRDGNGRGQNPVAKPARERSSYFQ
jgi:DNA-binding transcriptional regulator YiaG